MYLNKKFKYIKVLSKSLFPCSEEVLAIGFRSISGMLPENLNEVAFRAEAEIFRYFET